MPDHCSLQNHRSSERHDFLLFASESPNDDRWTEISTTPTSTFDHDRELRFLGKSAPKKSRVKESSKFFGVRFRPDLQKWVAEIRVAEWKSVDKKVWLGTFDTELGSARAVDAARKILNCKKKKPPNCPCVELDDYSETIPSHLNLNHLEKDAMFKEVTQFVKKKAREYASNLEIDNPSDCSPPVPMTSSFALPTHSFNMEIDFSFDSQTSVVSSCRDSNSLSSCEALPTSSLDSISISKFEDEEPHWSDLYEDHYNGYIISQPKGHSMDLMQCDNQPMVECEVKLHRSWESLTSFLFEDIGDDKLFSENMLVDYEYLILDNKQVFCAQEHASMDIVSKIEMPYDNCSISNDTKFQRQASSDVDTRMNWTLPELQLSSNSFLESSLDCAQVC